MGLNSLHNLFLRIKTGIGNCTHWQDPGKCHHLDMEMRHSRRYLHNSGQEALEKVSHEHQFVMELIFLDDLIMNRQC